MSLCGNSQISIALSTIATEAPTDDLCLSNLQSWPLKLGHLTLPVPLNQCCNQTSYAMQFARRVHSNIERWGRGGWKLNI